MTLLLDLSPDDVAYFNSIRSQYFPKYKLKDAAHLTLLYQIHEKPEVIINKLNTLNIPVFEVQSTEIALFPNGNAIKLASPQLLELHNQLKKLFKNKITRRDLIKFKPHITIQLGVTAFKAIQTKQILEQSFVPNTHNVVGLSLWEKKKNKAVCIHSLPFHK